MPCLGHLFISNEDMNDIVKFIQSWEDSVVLIDGVNETVKHEIKKEGRFLGAFICTFDCFIGMTRDFFGAKSHYWERSLKSRKRIYGQKNLVLLHNLSNIEITKYFNCEPRFIGAYS